MVRTKKSMNKGLELHNSGSDTSLDEELTIPRTGVAASFKEPVIKAVKKHKRTSWHNDILNKDSLSSDQVVLSFMLDVTWYQRYKGGDPHCGKTKIGIALDVLAKLADNGITNRKAKDICGHK